MRRVLAAFALTLAAGGVLTTDASAHARLVGASPAAGSTVTGPRAVTLRFDDVIQAPPGALQVLDPTDRNAAGVPSVPNDRTLQAPLPAGLPGGTYTVRWRIVADDGHVEAATFTFDVRGPRGHTSVGIAPAAPTDGGAGNGAIMAIVALSILATAAIGMALAGTFTPRRLGIPHPGALAIGAFAAMAVVGLTGSGGGGTHAAPRPTLAAVPHHAATPAPPTPHAMPDRSAAVPVPPAPSVPPVANTPVSLPAPTAPAPSRPSHPRAHRHRHRTHRHRHRHRHHHHQHHNPPAQTPSQAATSRNPCGRPGTTRVVEFGGTSFVYQPPDAGHSAAIRSCSAQSDQRSAPMPRCPPTDAQTQYGRDLAERTQQALQRYVNRPDLAAHDGFTMLPMPDSKWAYWVNGARIDDGHLLDPDRIEAFMAALTDRGWYPVGGMYMAPDKSQAPPNPTGCLLDWHRHVKLDGYRMNAESALPSLLAARPPDTSDQTVWMAHVWTYGGLDPWGRDYTGAEPHSWFGPFRPLPVVCGDSGCV